MWCNIYAILHVLIWPKNTLYRVHCGTPRSARPVPLGLTETFPASVAVGNANHSPACLENPLELETAILCISKTYPKTLQKRSFLSFRKTYDTAFVCVFIFWYIDMTYDSILYCGLCRFSSGDIWWPIFHYHHTPRCYWNPSQTSDFAGQYSPRSLCHVANILAVDSPWWVYELRFRFI